MDSLKTVKKHEKKPDEFFQKQKADASVFTRLGQLGMDRTNHIESLDMIGWSDPDAVSSLKAIKWLKSLEFNTNIYPDHIMNNAKKPPACIFVPSEKIMQSMIEATIKAKSAHELISMFSDMEPEPVHKIEASELF